MSLTDLAKRAELAMTPQASCGTDQVGVVLTEAHQQLAVKHLERMRRARNRFQYEARPLRGTDANTAADTAVTLVEAVRAQAS